MAQDGVVTKQAFGDRTEFNHFFKWDLASFSWHTTSGKKVFVHPPFTPNERWSVTVEETGQYHFLEGDDAEKRAFCIAETYSRQPY